MWKPYMKVMKAIAPQAIQAHDKFHLIQKLSDAIDKTRKQELKQNPILKKQKYTVLKNEENRTENQQIIFEQINMMNLKTSQAWRLRENFKDIFHLDDLESIFIL